MRGHHGEFRPSELFRECKRCVGHCFGAFLGLGSVAAVGRDSGWVDGHPGATKIRSMRAAELSVVADVKRSTRCVAGSRYASNMSLLNRISIDPEIVHGRPVVRGTRMRVADVLSLLAAGADEAEILEDYPYLTSEDIKACLAYAAARADHPIIAS